VIHDPGWLIYCFNKIKDKLVVFSGGPYLVFGRPFMLRPMPAFFNFSAKEMSKVPVWVKFPNLPLECWSPRCLSKIGGMRGKPL